MGLPPGPRLPPIAQLIDLSFRPVAFFDRCVARYGDLLTLRMPGLGAFVMVSAPALVKQVFTADPALLMAGKANTLLEPLVGRRSILRLDTDEHLRHRRLLMPPMHGERMRGYSRLMAEVTERVVAGWPVGAPFSLQPHMQAITLEVIVRAVFGVEETARIARLAPLLRAVLRPPPAPIVFTPWLQLDVPFSPFRTFLRRREAVDRELYALIAARRRAPVEGATDVLSLLLAARDDHGAPLGDAELRDELITMLVAGHETTASSLAWAFACLLADPAVEARLNGELDDLGEDPTAAPRLPYLDAVIKETLRTRPIIPDVVREAQEPYELGGYELPRGTAIAPFIYAVHRRPDLYPEPARFRPERFLGARIDPYAWFPFGGGVRRCLGMAFALHEMAIVLATVLSRARLRLTGPVRVARSGVTLVPSGGTRVVLEARRRPAAGRRAAPAAAAAG